MKNSYFFKKVAFVVLSLIVSFSVCAGEIAGYSSEEEMVKDLSDGYLYKDQKFVDRGEELEQLKAIVEQKILGQPTGPKNYVLLGMILSQLRSNNRKTIWVSLGRDEYLNGPEFEEYRQLITNNYLKAIELNELAPEKDKLTFELVSSITQDMLLDVDVAETAIRLEMSLSHTVPELSSTYTYNSYGIIYGAYLKAERYEDALRILDEMQQEFPHKASEVDDARLKTYSAQKEMNKEQLELKEKEPAKSFPVAEVKSDLLVKQTKSKLPIKPELIQEAAPSPGPKDTMLWYLLAAVIAVLVIGSFVMKRRP